MENEELKKEVQKYRNEHGYPETMEEMEKMAEHFWTLGFDDGYGCGANSIETM